MSTFAEVLRLGLIKYGDAYRIQKELLERRISGECPDTLILLQHEPVFTVGRNGTRRNILISDKERVNEGIELWEIERGGDVTYHGPGQIVAYPIFGLESWGKDVHAFIRMLEEVVIRTLAEYGLDSRRIEGLTGVWIGKRKIASIGIAVRRWVSFHGLSLNVSPDMRHFSFINPCGLVESEMTSMRDLTGDELNLTEVEGKLLNNFTDVFGITMFNSIACTVHTQTKG